MITPAAGAPVSAASKAALESRGVERRKYITEMIV
jgi:hypothetical protein